MTRCICSTAYKEMTIKMTYEVIILGHLHMPLYFIGTFTEYPYKI